MANWTIFEFVDRRGEGILYVWARSERLSDTDLACLDSKIIALSQCGIDKARGTKFLAGPVHNHIYKLRANGKVMMRPMLCRGPVNNDSEMTFLLGASERNGKLSPEDWKKRATENRQTLIHDPNRRREYEPFTE